MGGLGRGSQGKACVGRASSAQGVLAGVSLRCARPSAAYAARGANFPQRVPPGLPVRQVERRGTYRGGFYDPARSKIQAMKEIRVSTCAARVAGGGVRIPGAGGSRSEQAAAEALPCLQARSSAARLSWPCSTHVEVSVLRSPGRRTCAPSCRSTTAIRKRWPSSCWTCSSASRRWVARPTCPQSSGAVQSCRPVRLRGLAPTSSAPQELLILRPAATTPSPFPGHRRAAKAGGAARRRCWRHRTAARRAARARGTGRRGAQARGGRASAAGPHWRGAGQPAGAPPLPCASWSPLPGVLLLRHAFEPCKDLPATGWAACNELPGKVAAVQLALAPERWSCCPSVMHAALPPLACPSRPASRLWRPRSAQSCWAR